MKKHLSILLRILGYYFLYILIANIGIVFILLLLNQIGITDLPTMTGEFISDVLLLPVLVIIFHLYSKERRSKLFKEPFKWKKVAQLIPISLLARVLLVLAIALIAVLLIVVLDKDIASLIDSGVDFQWSAFDEGEGYERLFGFLSFVIFGPINEELLNRAVILEYLRKHYSVKVSIIYSSIIFMIAHLHPGLYISSFLLGLVLAYIYTKWNNLWYPIILHMLINLQPFILDYFMK